MKMEPKDNPPRIKYVKNESSLLLQMLLNFNVYADPVWISSQVYVNYLLYNELVTFDKVIMISLLITTTILEVLRLFCGYSGNLIGNMANYAGFLIVSAFLQLPLQIYQLMFELKWGFVYGTLVFYFQVLTMVQLIIQIGVGFFNFKAISKKRSQMFYLQSSINKKLFKKN